MDAFLDLLARWARWTATGGRRPSRPHPSEADGLHEPAEGRPPATPLPRGVLEGLELCPEDGTLLEAAPSPFEGVGICPACHGCFVQKPLDEELAKTPNLLDGLALPGGPRGPDPVRYRPCPTCRQQMNRRNFERVSGIVVDQCVRHGTWFDAGELEAAVRFIMEGGGERKAAFEAREKAWQDEQRKIIKKWTREGAMTRSEAFSYIYDED